MALQLEKNCICGILKQHYVLTGIFQFMAAAKKSTSMGIAYEKIMQKIMAEQLLPGTPLREERLAEEFGISATPVREAFRRLEYEGWVQSKPYQGCFMRKFTRRDIDELFQLREMLEGMAAAAAAREAKPEYLVKMKECLTAEEDYLLKSAASCQTDNVSPTLYEDLDFHTAIADASCNQLLKQRLSMLKSQIYLSFMLRRKISGDLAEQTRVFEEHTMIYNAIVRKWDDLAESLMRRHIADARNKYTVLSIDFDE